MKLKLLLLIFLLSGGMIKAQDTIRTLIITEARMTHPMENYVEITNVGDFEIQLGDFEFGLIRPYNNVPWTPEDETRHFMLPEKILSPGESYIISSAYDLAPKMFNAGSDEYQEKITKDELWNSDLLLHAAEALHGEPGDSVTEPHYWTFFTYSGRGCWYIRQHFSETDSVVVDQVGGVFDMENGLNNPEGHYDVAGVTGATGNSVLIRKFNVKTGNLDFANSRGVGLDDSEWIPVPIQGGFAQEDQRLGHWRAIPWTLGNHGDYNLDENTLESDIIEVDFANKKLMVPWGIRGNDDIMRSFKQKPGISWKYDFSTSYEDSMYMSVRTGDKLTVYVCGNDVDVETFDIVVQDPSVSSNIVVPKYNIDPAGDWRTTISEGQVDWPRVSQNESGVDTITGKQFGLPYATRVDSLIERLEKAPNANWEFVWVDGVERADLKDGDILKVTAADNSVKEYYIQVKAYLNDGNALLSSITWPDIPEMYKDILGWKYDTIPGFSPASLAYKVQVPLDYEGIPALVAKTANLNAKIEVKRASSLYGSPEQRTVTFTVTAQDDTTIVTYTIELIKEKNPVNIQPYNAEPFFSEYVFQFNWGPTTLLEICNPGNQVLDLSDYMIIGHPSNDLATVLTASSGVDDWGTRYNRYVPGYKWVSQADWQSSPSMLVQDLNVNPFIAPGDVFVFGNKNPPHQFQTVSEIDLDFVGNPWGEFIHPFGQTVTRRWANHNFYIFKILNDSIKQGLKPATDINDFELIEVFGTGDGSMPQLGINFDQTSTTIRKPEFTEPRKLFKESFNNLEFEHKPFLGYWIPNGVGDTKAVTWDLGTHFFIEPTIYKSTISSVVYKVSPGYKTEAIRGPITGTTVSEFLGNIVKSNDNQSLSVRSTADGSELGMDAALSLNDTLRVLSADSTNITRYVIEVSENGLSADALITSTRYKVEVEVAPKNGSNENAGMGNISGFEYGTSLKTILANINIPAGAIMNIIDDKGHYVPLKQLNFDTAYVNVTVNANTYFEVIAENAVTQINYQLLPDVTESSAFLTSNVYNVSQKELLIEFVPRGTSVPAFLSNLYPSAGAKMMLVDKIGNERIDGNVADDDKVVVTSPDETTSRVYYISKLRTEYILETTYLAYVLSPAYKVDQVSYMIYGASKSTSVTEFYSKIVPATGATAMVVNADGVEKSSGNLEKGDMVSVTSADGKIMVYYSIDLETTSTNSIKTTEFALYPNPTNAKINVSGVLKGNRIQVYNSVGALVNTVNVENSIEVINLSNQPVGMYLIVISQENQILGRFKVLKQ